MPDFPPDRFDDVPAVYDGRVGAHRAPRSRAARWRLVGIAALATGLIVGAGLVALGVIDESLELDIPTIADPADPGAPAEPDEPAVQPITSAADADLPEGFTITILDGTGSVGRGPQAEQVLDAQGWPVGTVTQAADTDIAETVVYYSSESLEGVALGMVQLLDDIADIELSDAFPGADITIVLGSDYVLLPGA